MKLVPETVTIFEAIDADGDIVILAAENTHTQRVQSLIAYFEEEVETLRPIAALIGKANGLKVFEVKYHCISKREL